MAPPSPRLYYFGQYCKPGLPLLWSVPVYWLSAGRSSGWSPRFSDPAPASPSGYVRSPQYSPAPPPHYLCQCPSSRRSSSGLLSRGMTLAFSAGVFIVASLEDRLSRPQSAAPPGFSLAPPLPDLMLGLSTPAGPCCLAFSLLPSYFLCSPPL